MHVLVATKAVECLWRIVVHVLTMQSQLKCWNTANHVQKFNDAVFKVVRGLWKFGWCECMCWKRPFCTRQGNKNLCKTAVRTRVWVYLLPCSVCMCTRLRYISCGRPRWMGMPKGVFNPLYLTRMRRINMWLREKQGKEWRFCTRLVALYFVN